MGKRMVGIIVGVVVANLTVFLLEAVSEKMYPAPAGLRVDDAAAMKAYIGALPIGALLIVLLAYVVGSFLGGASATLLSGRDSLRPALIVGGVLTAIGIYNLASFPHPLWFAVVSTLCYLPLAWIGGRIWVRQKA